MKKPIPAFLNIFAALLATGAVLASCGKTENPPSDTSGGAAGTESAAITFTSEDIDRNEVDESVFSGKKLTMINVWATYCGPCIDEMPDLGEINDEYAGEGVQIIGIVADVLDRKGEVIEANIDLAKEIIAETGADYLHILPSASLGTALLNSVIYVPTTIFVDEDGKQIGEVYVGSKTKDKWVELIDSLLGQVS